MAIRDVIIGTLTGIAAVAAMRMISPKTQPAPIIRGVMTHPISGAGSSRANSTTQPDPALQKLETVLESVEIKRFALSEAIAKLAQLTGANFIVEWRALGEVQVGDDYPITVSLRKVPARIVLQAMLDQIGAEREKISYRVQDGIVRISTASHLAHERFVRVYDIRDVIDDLFASGKNFPGRDAEPSKKDAIDQVTAAIQQGVDPNSWRDAGGMASMEVFAGRLIVKQSLENHEAIARILADFRRKQK